MHIGILQTGHAPDALIGEHGDYDAMFRRMLDGHGFDFTTWSVVDGVFPDGPEDAEGWLITGSRHGAYEDHPWIPPLETLIRAIYDRRVPMVGICFGHQIIAQALGGTVVKHPGGWSVGRQVYRFADGHEMPLYGYHQDQVVRLPADAQRLASSDLCENAVLVYGDRAYTIQPHPEFDGDFVAGLLEHRAIGVVPDDLIARAQATLDGGVAKPEAADRIAAFLKRRAA